MTTLMMPTAMFIDFARSAARRPESGSVGIAYLGCLLGNPLGHQLGGPFLCCNPPWATWSGSSGPKHWRAGITRQTNYKIYEPYAAAGDCCFVRYLELTVITLVCLVTTGA